MTVYCPLSTQPVFFMPPGGGQPQIQVGAYLQVYDAGTLTPRTVYKDGLAVTPWLQVQPGVTPPPDALVTDSNGTIPNFWVVGNPYRVRITSPRGLLIRDVDNLPGDVASGGGGGGGGGTSLVTGDYVFAHTTAVITGRVRANGKTIGNAISGATERANADTQSLFVFLWNADTALAVSGGRGASAIADYGANKTITTPDLNCRTLFGIDGMGSVATGRLANALFSTGNATTLGSAGGEAAHALTLAENGPHTHTGTTVANAAFQLTFTTGAAGAHDHGGITSTENASHTHSGTTGTESAPHTHTGSTDTSGAHTHTGTTGIESNSHSHGYTAPGAGATVNGGATFSVAQAGFSSSTLNASTTHTHNFSTDSAGSHAHGITTGTASVTHTHSITTGTESANHAHTITAVGTHQHTGSTDLGGSHTHTFTTASSGSGTAHNNMPPFVLATCYIIL
jgi:hypothetical protein